MLFPTDDVIQQACQAVFGTVPLDPPKCRMDMLSQLAWYNGAVHKHLRELGYGYLNNNCIINQSYEIVKKFLQPVYQDTPYAY